MTQTSLNVADTITPPPDGRLSARTRPGAAPGSRQMLVAREAGVEGKYSRSFELMRLDTLATERRAGDPELLGAFQRWQDPAWKRLSLSLR